MMSMFKHITAYFTSKKYIFISFHCLSLSHKINTQPETFANIYYKRIKLPFLSVPSSVRAQLYPSVRCARVKLCASTFVGWVCNVGVVTRRRRSRFKHSRRYDGRSSQLNTNKPVYTHINSWCSSCLIRARTHRATSTNNGTAAAFHKDPVSARS